MLARVVGTVAPVSITFDGNVLNGKAQDDGPDHSQGHLQVAVDDFCNAAWGLKCALMMMLVLPSAPTISFTPLLVMKSSALFTLAIL